MTQGEALCLAASRGAAPRECVNLLVIHHTVDPNMVPVLARLGTIPGIAASVLFASRLPPHRTWSMKLPESCHCRFLPRLQINVGRKGAPFVLRVNPTIAREIMKSRPDVVISTPFPGLTSLTALVMCRLMGKPFVLDIYTMGNSSPGRKLLSPILKSIIRNCAAFVAKSSRTVEYLRSLGAASERIFLSHHAVDYESFRERSRLDRADRARLLARYGIEEGRIVLYVGRLVERKGIKILLDAFKRLRSDRRDASLVLVGDGYQRRELEAMCSREAIGGVHFTGPLAHEELPRLYGLADVFVLPSISTGIQALGEEVWGFVVGEAIACGLPVVTTDKVGGSDDLVREGINGYVVRERDADQLYRALKRILDDDDLRARMREASARLAEQFSYDRAACGYRAAIEYVRAGTGAAG